MIKQGEYGIEDDDHEYDESEESDENNMIIID
jgi:hypothetical protein